MIPRLTLPILDPTKHCWSQTYGLRFPISCALSAYDTGPIMTEHLGLGLKPVQLTYQEWILPAPMCSFLPDWIQSSKTFFINFSLRGLFVLEIALWCSLTLDMKILAARHIRFKPLKNSFHFQTKLTKQKYVSSWHTFKRYSKLHRFFSWE